MALILSLETATNICAVALHENGELLGELSSPIERSHGSVLTVLIDKLLTNKKIDKQRLSAIAVSIGPGSYTGLRIGLSTAKGIAFSFDIPLIGIISLEGIAKHAQLNAKGHQFYIPMIDARRDEVYTLIADSTFRIIKKTEALILESNSFEELLGKGKVLFCGDGAQKAQHLIKESNNAQYKPEIATSAHAIGVLAYDKWKFEDFEDLAYCEPFYLKDVRITTPKKMLNVLQQKNDK